MIKLLKFPALFVFVLILQQGFSGLAAQEKLNPGIKWMDIEEAVNKSSSEPRKLMIYIYSDNCGWCRKMNNESFSEPVISNYINDNFYPVKLNASLSRDVILGNRTYKFVPADKEKNNPSYHELVITLLNGRLAYPALSFISEKMEYMGVEFGYKNPGLLEAWLHFIAGNEFLTTPDFTTFQSTFKGQL